MPEVNLSYYLQVFGTPNGHMVLRDLLGMFDNACHSNNSTEIHINEGRKQVVDFILKRLKEASKSKDTYAKILYEVNTL